YELLVLPEGDVDDLLHELDRFAARVRTGEVVHYERDKGRIERATVGGQTADAIVELLDAHARSPVPQNVAYSIRSWAGDVRSATLMRGVVFTANDSSVVEAVLNHPVLKEWVEQTFEPNTVFFNEKVTERQIVQELRSMGVYVQ
ncbi:MAG: helicase-associated domain-containing protein, partial [Planctomycetota bacterium]